MVLQEKLKLKPLSERTRLSDIPAGTFTTVISRKAFKKALKNELVTLNGATAKTSDFVSGGEIIEIFSNESASKKPAIIIPLKVIFEDNYLAVIDKPAGIEVSGNKKYTIANALLNVLQPSLEKDALLRPLPAHRLDYPTSGCLLIGKTSNTITALHQLFEYKKIEKTYLAVTIYKQKPEGEINEPVDDKESLSIFKVLKTIPSSKYGALNLVKLQPKTGRRHQLRKHLALTGNPIFGEKKYGNPENQGHGNGLYLQAHQLKFTHPVTGEIILAKSPVAKKFSRLFGDIQNFI